MQPVELDDIPDEVFLEDIFELTATFADESPALFNIMCASLSIAPEDLLITDFVEDENDENKCAGYAYDRRNKKMYDYTFDHDRVHICEVAIDSLTVRDTFSVRVLHLL